MVIQRGSADGLTAGTTYYYKVRGVTHTGQQSALSSQVSASFTGVTDSFSDITVAGFFKLDVAGNFNAPTDSAFNTAFGRLPMDGDFVIVQNTSASPKVSKSYKYANANSGGGGGSFTEVTNLITGDQLVTGTLGADRIVANSLSSASGVFGTITATDFFATGTMNANRLQIDDATIDTDANGNLIVATADGTKGLGAFQLLGNAATWAAGLEITASSSINTTHRTDTQQYIVAGPITLGNTGTSASARPNYTFVEAQLNFLANTGSGLGTARIGIHQSTDGTKSIGTLIGSSQLKGTQATSMEAGFSVSMTSQHTYSNTSGAAQYYYYVTWSATGGTGNTSYRRGSGDITLIGRQR